MAPKRDKKAKEHDPTGGRYANVLNAVSLTPRFPDDIYCFPVDANWLTAFPSLKITMFYAVVPGLRARYVNSKGVMDPRYLWAMMLNLERLIAGGSFLPPQFWPVNTRYTWLGCCLSCRIASLLFQRL